MSRNSREIRSKSGLPSWFNISKYQSSVNLDYKDWYQNLFMRAELLRLIGSNKNKIGLENKCELSEEISSELSNLRATPIYFSKLNNGGFRILNYSMLHRTPDSGVRHMTVRDLYQAELQLDEKKRLYARKHIGSECDSNEFIFDMYEFTEREPEWVSNPLDDVLPNGLFKVNLLLPDILLVEQFKSSLKLSKELHNTKLSTGKWVEFGVLPFLDLKIWELESNVQIVNQVLADVIFPNTEASGEAIRKTTEKHAMHAISEDSLFALADLASNELATQSKK